jgi:hypothetical protein
MSAEQLDKLKEALANTKSADFRWENLEEEMDETKDTAIVDKEIADLSAYTSLFGNSTFSITGNSGTSSGSYVFSNGSNPVWTTNNTSGVSYTTTPASVEVKGDLIVNGKNIGNILDKIQDRLAILDEPSPEKLEKHAALRTAYEQYKLLEKLIGEE